MKIPYSWLSEYINLDCKSVEEVANMLTLSGTEVLSIDKVGGNIPGVVVGKVVSTRKHPDADKLSICSVDIGAGSPISIVCGAPNVDIDIFVPVATVGTLLASGVTIKKSSIRGFESNGMLCSKQELGFEDNSDGIWILDEANDEQIGDSISTVVGTTDYVLDLDITTNRSDLLSIIGIARECAVLSEKRVINANVKTYESVGGNVDIAIEDDACFRYSARMIIDVEIAPSPDWLVRRLHNCGIRSVNNVVDITNYILLEYGQPLHAFDLDKVKDKKIVVRKARDGEKLTVINGNTIELNNEMLVIADSEKPIGLAGVMGGLDSEITSETKNILIESANFAPITIRKSSKMAGIKSDASYRYERGVDIEMTVAALNRAVDLILNITKSGKIASKVKDTVRIKQEKKSIVFDCTLTQKFLNLNLSVAELSSIFNRFSFPTANIGGTNLRVDIPSYRRDISIDMDLLEEVARIYGYNKIETTRPSIKSNFIKTDYSELSNIRHAMAGFGFYETKNYSITSSKLHKNIGYDESLFIPVLEPINSDYDILRPSAFASLMNIISYNKKRNILSAKFFDLGNVFAKNTGSHGDDDKRYIEKKILSAAVFGDNVKKAWNESARKNDIFDVLGVIEAFITKSMKIDGYRIEAQDNFLFIPSKSASILINDKCIGVVGQVHPKILRTFDLKEDVFYFELDAREIIATVAQKNASEFMYRDIGRYPSVYRDLALVCSKEVVFADVIKNIKQTSPIIKSITVLDRYEGEQVAGDKVSIAISIVYNDNTRTLKEDDVNKAESDILEMLKSKFDIEIRS